MSGPSFLQLLPLDEREAFEVAIKTHPPRCVRRRRDRVAKPLPFPSRGVEWHDLGHQLTDSSLRPSQYLEYGRGDYYIQDAGSLLALSLLNPQPHEWICDLCAAPGGKATAIAEQLGEGGMLIANEPIRSREAILRYALTRTGQPRYAVTQLDPDSLATRFGPIFDAVLVDAPCSGQTMVLSGKRGENAYDPRQIEHSAQRQRRILAAAVRLLKPGGRLVYSTCTFSVEENEDQIAELYHQFPDAWQALEVPRLARWRSTLAPGCYRLWPHRDPTSGAFAAGLVLHRELDARPPDPALPGSHSRRRFPGSGKSVTKSLGTEVWDSLGHLQGLQLVSDSRGGIHGGVLEGSPFWSHRLTCSEWPKWGTIQENRLKPEHALAMLEPKWFVPHQKAALTADEASLFLKGLALRLSPPIGCAKEGVTGKNGDFRGSGAWWVATWEGAALGWLKQAGERMNNHLPRFAWLDALPSTP